MNNQAGPKPQGDSVQRTTETATPAPVANSRRRFVRGAASAVPVLLAVSGRSALATPSNTSCNTVKGLSPMAWLSYHPNGSTAVRCPSHTVNPNTLGKSPGLWKPNMNGKTFQQAWPTGIAPFTTVKKSNGSSVSWNAANWNSYSGLVDDSQNSSGWAAGTKATMLGDGRSFSRILLDSNGTLIWHLCAAYLNALYNETIAGGGASGYALTSSEVIAIANNSLMGSLDDSALKAFLGQTWA